MVKVLISGYYGFDNAGDDTVLFGIISSLRRHIQQVDITVLSNKPEETRDIFGIPAFNRWSPVEITRQIRRCDLLVMGGGSLLQDATSPRSVIYYLGIVTIAKMLKKPVIFYAQGVGPISHPLSKKLIDWVVNRVDVITVRDQQSGEDLKSFGVRNAPIYVTADPALTIDPDDIDLRRGKEILNRYIQNNQRPNMSISVRKWKHQTKYRAELAKMADELVNEGWNVFLLPMQYPADIAESEEIIKLMNHPQKDQSVFLLNQKMNFHDIISVIGNMDFVLGMRLHSLILAAVTNVPFTAITYDPKVDRFVQRLNMGSAGNLQELSYEQLSRAVRDVLNDLPGTREKLKNNMKQLVQEAEKGSELARQLVEHKKGRG